MDTIIACSSPNGQGGVALLRMSGSLSISIAKKLSGRRSFRARYAHFCSLYHHDQQLDQVLLIVMPNPHSFTGEDVVEISCHGNPLVVQQIIDACIECGARVARPGEFTRRALENGKMSLLQAEALNGFIHARTLEGIQLVRNNMKGELDKDVLQMKEQLLDICAELEAILDHPDDDLSMMSDDAICSLLQEIANVSHQSAQNWKSNRIGIKGAKVALIGSVNAGKSSLFNQLVGFERAIVSDIPGTTRDVVEKTILLDGMEICFFDTAGARIHTEDSIEAQGIAMGISMAKDVDLCLIVFSLKEWEQNQQYIETQLDELAQSVYPASILKVGTHLDLVHDTPTVDSVVSNYDREGIETLKKKILENLRARPSSAAAYTVVSQRQYELFLSIARHCHQACEAIMGIYGPAVAVEEVISALERISELTGEEVREQVLDRLFSKFCIGK